VRFDATVFLESLHRPAAASDVCTRFSPADLPADLRDLWEERAAIREHDGGLARDRAEALALEDVLCQMHGRALGRDGHALR
jgi:hypothetical protein